MPSGNTSENATDQVKALLFDVFGTVVDWRGGISREAAAFGARHGIDRDWMAFADDWRGLYQPAMEQVRAGNRGFVRLDVLHRENLDQLFAKYEITGISEEETDHLNRAWHRLRPWEDVLPGLHRLHRQYVLATLSNGNIALMVNMARNSGLPWDAVLGAEVTRSYKPMPETYLGSCEALGLRPDQCMLVAAHNGDLQAARDCGMQTAYINRPYEYGPHQKVDFEATSDWEFIANDMVDLADRMGCR